MLAFRQSPHPQRSHTIFCRSLSAYRIGCLVFLLLLQAASSIWINLRARCIRKIFSRISWVQHIFLAHFWAQINHSEYSPAILLSRSALGHFTSRYIVRHAHAHTLEAQCGSPKWILRLFFARFQEFKPVDRDSGPRE